MLFSFFLASDEDRQKFPNLFHPQKYSENGNGKTEMRLIIFGMPRTATSSLKEALTQLSITPTYHMSTLKQNPKDGAFWERAAKAKFYPQSGVIPPSSAEWRNFLGQYQAVIDAPAAAFVEEIMEAFPYTPVLIVERDADKWLQSYSQTIGMPAKDWLLKLEPYLERQTYLTRELIFNGLVGTYKLDGSRQLDEQTKLNYLDMYRHIRSVVPKERLVEFDIKQGWEPLCQMVGQPIPSSPFPHVNDSRDFQRIKQLAIILALDRIFVKFLQGCLFLMVLWLLFQKLS